MESSTSRHAPGDPSGAADGSAIATARPVSWLRRRVWLVDLVIALGVFLYNLPILPSAVRSPVQGAVLLAASVVMCGIVLLRRRRPVEVFAVVLGASCVGLLLGAPLLPMNAMLLPALHTLASRRSARLSVPAALLIVIWMVAALTPHLREGSVSIGQLAVLVVVTAWVWTWGDLVRVRRQREAALRDRADQAERQRESDARMAVEQERSRIAREIHDVVSHSLSVVVVMSDGAAAIAESDPPRAREAMQRVRDTGRGALAEMRQMLGVLRSDERGTRTPQPGISQLDALVAEARGTGMPVRLAVDGPVHTLGETAGLAVYRVVQEALTNIRKHAGPAVTAVDVHVEHRGEEIAVHVLDDGRGPAAAGGREDPGHGLLGMRERVTALGGAVTTGPRAGGGFSVRASLPAEKTA